MIHGASRICTPVLAISLVLLACAPDGAEVPVHDGADDGVAAAVDAPRATLDIAAGVGVRNARMPLEGIVTAGQPTVDQLEELEAAGFENFISLRPATEEGAGWEEEHASGRSYDFERLPISGGGSLTRENVEVFATILEEAGDGPTVLYCASSNRVGAMMALKAHWIDGVDAREALELGRAAGMTRLEGTVTELLGLAESDR